MKIKNFLSLVLSVALLCLLLPMDFVSSLSAEASYVISYSSEPATTYTTTIAPDSETTVTPVEPVATTTTPVTTTTTVTTSTIYETTTTTAVTTTSSEETTTTTSTSDEPDPSYTTTTTTSTSTTTTMTTSTTSRTTSTTTSTTTTTTHTTVTTTTSPSNLILQCSVSCSDNPGELVMSGKTQGVERMDSLGFRNVRILRSTDLNTWYEEFYIGNISMRNSLVCMVDGYTVSVQGGAYYRISCEHFAKLDGATQFVDNLSDYVWVDSAPVIITSTTTATNVTTKITETTAGKSTALSSNNSVTSGNSGSSVNATDSPKTDASMPAAPFVVLLCAVCSALILRRRVR